MSGPKWAPMDFTGWRAIVTGGSSGIGLASAEMLAARGASVVVLDRERPEGEVPGVNWLPVDVRDDDQVRGAVGAAVQGLGGLDVLVNNAGIGAQGTVEDNTDDEWRAVFDVNVFGMARVSRAAMPSLRASEHAAVVNTCSVVADVGLPRRALYSASKGAVLALTRAMAADGIADGTRVNCVSPGTVDTPWVGRLLEASADPRAERTALEARQPHGRLVRPEEVAAAVCYLAGPYSGSVTGTELVVDGGLFGLRLPARR